MPELAIKQKVIGQIFIALLKMLVVLLVFASIFIAISGLGSLKQLKKNRLKNGCTLSYNNCPICFSDCQLKD